MSNDFQKLRRDKTIMYGDNISTLDMRITAGLKMATLTTQRILSNNLHTNLKAQF
jgi:hypothetical protein